MLRRAVLASSAIPNHQRSIIREQFRLRGTLPVRPQGKDHFANRIVKGRNNLHPLEVFAAAYFGRAFDSAQIKRAVRIADPVFAASVIKPDVCMAQMHSHSITTCLGTTGVQWGVHPRHDLNSRAAGCMMQAGKAKD
jgi:hypothetical protein